MKNKKIEMTLAEKRSQAATKAWETRRELEAAERRRRRRIALKAVATREFNAQIKM